MTRVSGSVPIVLLILLVIGLVLAAGYTVSQPFFSTKGGMEPAGTSGNFTAPNETRMQEILEDFDSYAGQARQDWKVPGMAVAIVKDDKVVFLKGYGVKTEGGSDPVTPDTIFQIGSDTKAFTAAVVATEVDRGSLRWDDPVIDHYPDFALYDPNSTRNFTITDAMTHRSGLPDHWGDDLGMLGYDQDYILKAVRYVPPLYDPGSGYTYENVLYMLPVGIIRNKTGKPWQDTLSSRVFTPLHMTNSSADYTSFVSAGDAATPHTFRVGSDGSILSSPIASRSIMNTFSYMQPGASGVNSNARDMASWLRFQLGNGTFEGTRIVSGEGMRYMHSPQTLMPMNTSRKEYYCVGWVYQEMPASPVLWHSGATGGFRSMVLLVPDQNVGIVILANNGLSELPDVLAWQFYAQYYGNSTIDLAGLMQSSAEAHVEETVNPTLAIPSSPAPSLPVSRLAGTYYNDIYGNVLVGEDNGGLNVTIGPREVELQLVHRDGNTFIMPASEFFTGIASFGVDGNGMVRNLTLPLERPALFRRVSAQG